MTDWRMATMFSSLSRRPYAPALLACILVAISLALAWKTERQAADQRMQQIEVQARVIAAAATGALAFDDKQAIVEYLSALEANVDIEAAAVFDSNGQQVARYRRGGDLPSAAGAPYAPRIEGNRISIISPIQEGSLPLGTVYVRSKLEPWQQRASRYLGIGVVVLLAAMMIALLGASYLRAKEANHRLAQEMAAREQAEAALREAQKMEAIGQLTGGVAHDFNNLLMAARSGMQLLERSQDPARREQLKAGVLEAIDRGARLTQQLLTFARRSPVKPEPMDVHARFAGLVELLHRSLNGQAELIIELDHLSWLICVDPNQFDLALLNIVVNARDAIAEKGRITITAWDEPDGLPSGDAVAISIADTGAGMPCEIMEKVFEPFFTTKPVGSGTGLGLSQVYGFARGADGTVNLHSTVGQGTVVTMKLPRCERD